MPCLLTQGFLLDCNEGVGGVKEIFFCNWEDFQSGVTTDPATGLVDGLPTATIFRYQPNRNTGALTVVPTANLENGTLYYDQTVELTLGKLSNFKKQELENMSKAKLIVFVRLYDDQILMVGRTDGAFLTSGSYQSGKAKGDLNGYQITVNAQEPAQPDFLEAYTADPFDNFATITVDPAY
jgi:hypothetical protein